ncbi:heterokaryon incompatibility protein-domain-containing protein [Xylariales sp. PMI_506]|nr:heterokaryon incompatibility protein-domain-containing protein [Xylariales sp. PMI_506]
MSDKVVNWKSFVLWAGNPDKRGMVPLNPVQRRLVSVILYSIGTRLVPQHIKLLEPVTDSNIHISQHHVPTSLLVFQDGVVNCSFQLLQKLPKPNNIGHGKLVDANWIDTNLLRSWKNCCAKSHGDKCQSSLSRQTRNLFPARPRLLIDTWRMCLTESPDDDRYIALSYVWGDSHAFRTTQQDLARLKEDQSLALAIRNSRIPKTIVHAIHLVGILKERFLWVDALCIIQDDEKSKHEDFNSMVSIYANSVLTIVAAEGDHADCGIRGLRGVSESRKCQQRVFDLDSGRVRIVHVPWPILFETTWFNRGWTFQEWLFSPRRLIFGDTRVRWECNESCWQEDIDHISGPAAAPFPLGPDNIKGIRKELSMIWPDTVAYAKLVRFYNKREFTYAEDVLSAFAGITSLLASIFDGGFLYGLPEMFFDVALLWLPYSEVVRRVARNVNSPCLQGSQLPSWSWMGWHGEIEPWSWLAAKSIAIIQGEGPGDVWIIPLVHWKTGFRSTTVLDRREILQSGLRYSNMLSLMDEHPPPPSPWTKHEIISERNNAERAVSYRHPSIPDTYFLYPLPIPDPSLSASNPPQTPLLFCSAPRAWFYATNDFNIYRPAVSLRRHNGLLAGFLNLHDYKTQELFPKTGLQEKVELIAISEGFVVTSKTRKCHAPQLDELQIYPQLIDGDFYEFYNVLYIIWENGMAYRKGVGRVFRTAWEEYSTEWVDICLG